MQWPWSKKSRNATKAKPEEPVEFTHEEHARARVYRMDPEKWKDRPVGGFLRGDFTELKSKEDLENRIAEQCGGGTYYADVYKKGMSGVWTRFHFKLAGDPLINGKPVRPLEEDDMRGSEKEPPKPESVKKLEEQIAVTEKQAELRRIKRESGLDDDEDAGPIAQQLQNQILELQQMIATRDQESDERARQREEREREERRHREAIEMMREQSKQQMDMMTALISSIAGNRGGDAEMFKAQVDVMREISTSNSKQIETVMKQIELNRREQTESTQKMFELVMGKSDKLAEIVMQQAQQTVEARGNSAAEQMEFFNKALSMALQFSEGRAPTDEEAVTSWSGFADRLSNRLFDTVNGVIALKGQQAEMTHDGIKRKIEEAARETVREQMESPNALPAPPEDEPEPNPRPVAPRRAPARPAPQQSKPAAHEVAAQRDPRAGMDRVLMGFLKAANAGLKNPWAQVRAVALQSLPPTVLQELAAAQSDGEKVAVVIKKYGSPDLADQALKVAAAMATGEPEPGKPAEPAPARRPAKPRARRARPARGSLAEAAAEGATAPSSTATEDETADDIAEPSDDDTSDDSEE